MRCLCWFAVGGSELRYRSDVQEMNALNLQRCRCIPKNVPGADWRVLQQLVAEDPSKELYQVRWLWSTK